MLYLIGGGCHANVVLDILKSLEYFYMRDTGSLKSLGCRLAYISVAGYYDDCETLLPVPYLGKICDIPVYVPLDSSNGLDALSVPRYICCIGDISLRHRIVESLKRLNWATIIHAKANVSPTARIGQGSVICVGANISSNTVIGDHVIVNTGASVDHHNYIGSYSHIAPGVTICGNVKIGVQTLIGVGSKIVPNIHIGDKVIIGAGSIILTDIPDNITVVGTVKRDKVNWLPSKVPNYKFIENVLLDSAKHNHYSNEGPCVKKLEKRLYEILEIDSEYKSIIITNN